MVTNEDVKHDLLLIIVTAISLLFVTGLAGPSTVPDEPIVFP
ncbi:hypothetical protein [Desulfolucanica intricata]|nr:hypothetical protein [Desulfolucanica intricata]